MRLMLYFGGRNSLLKALMPGVLAMPMPGVAGAIDINTIAHNCACAIIGGSYR